MSPPSNQELTQCEFEVEIKDNVTIVKIPETYVDEPLTDQEKENLLQLEEEFSYRYSNEDEDYVATVKQGNTTPPLISSYRPFRNHRRGQDNRSRPEKRSWEDRRSYNDNRQSHNSHNDFKRQNYNYNSGYNHDYRR